TGIDKLKSLLVEVARSHARVVELRIPYDRSRIVSEIHELGEVIEQSHEERFTRLRVRLSPAVADRFTDYQL
ncbi:MAG: GTPase HflX, partial [Acidimicrobiia bacterium]|nr:GTPase HflX [Acidimicrobiia bacterium]